MNVSRPLRQLLLTTQSRSQVLINEAAARFMGFGAAADAVGRQIIDRNPAGTGDFVYTSAIMQDLQQQWQAVMGTAVFTTTNIDTLLASEYAPERSQGRVFFLFSALAVCIACLGYRIDALLLLPVCVLAGVVALSVACMAIACGSLKAAVGRPVLALKHG